MRGIASRLGNFMISFIVNLTRAKLIVALVLLSAITFPLDAMTTLNNQMLAVLMLLVILATVGLVMDRKAVRYLMRDIFLSRASPVVALPIIVSTFAILLVTHDWTMLVHSLIWYLFSFWPSVIHGVSIHGMGKPDNTAPPLGMRKLVGLSCIIDVFILSWSFPLIVEVWALLAIIFVLIARNPEHRISDSPVIVGYGLLRIVITAGVIISGVGSINFSAAFTCLLATAAMIAAHMPGLIWMKRDIARGRTRRRQRSRRWAILGQPISYHRRQLISEGISPRLDGTMSALDAIPERLRFLYQVVDEPPRPPA